MIPSFYPLDVHADSVFSPSDTQAPLSREARLFSRTSFLLTYIGGGLFLTGALMTYVSMDDLTDGEHTNVSVLAGMVMCVAGAYLWGAGEALGSA